MLGGIWFLKIDKKKPSKKISKNVDHKTYKTQSVYIHISIYFIYYKQLYILK